MAEKETVLSSLKCGYNNNYLFLSSSQPDSNEANTAFPMLKSVSNSNVKSKNTDMTKRNQCCCQYLYKGVNRYSNKRSN
jgi:hypothetical protein